LTIPIAPIITRIIITTATVVANTGQAVSFVGRASVLSDPSVSPAVVVTSDSLVLASKVGVLRTLLLAIRRGRPAENHTFGLRGIIVARTGVTTYIVIITTAIVVIVIIIVVHRLVRCIGCR
jgi:hypothetical protein